MENREAMTGNTLCVKRVNYVYIEKKAT